MAENNKHIKTYVTKDYVDHDLVINSLDNSEWFRISKDNVDLISTGHASFTVPDDLDLSTSYNDDAKLMAEFKGKQENFVAYHYSMTQGKTLQCLLPIDNSVCLGILMENSHPSEGIEDGAFDDFTIEVMFMNPNTFETIVPPEGLLTEDIVLFKSYQCFNDNFTRNNISFANSLANLNSEASGINSIAVGGSCYATGNMSAAFGRMADASGYVSFAAGSGNATGEYSYAVNGGHADGAYSHAANKGNATGESSHAVNNGNAQGKYSHAEGYATLACGENQHVQGRLNITDTENKYAHIVGNGTRGTSFSDPDKRSNAHTLDWDGNAWYQGNVSIDGTPTNDNDLVTKKYVDDSISQASISGSDITKAEIEAKLTGTITSHDHNGTYAPVSHGVHVPTPEAVSFTKFLRNDNTWQDVTPANIGAATSGELTITNANIGTLSDLQTSATDSLVNATNELYQSLSTHNHGLLHNNHTVEMENTTTDNGWSMINSDYNGFILKSIRTNLSAPNWICDGYASGVAFGGGDTKGVLSCAYHSPSIKIAGGNGTAPLWWIGLTGTSNTTYDLNEINTAYTHSQAAHAPTDAQKNSDITKAEIEAKLTGNIESHTHDQYLTEVPSNYATQDYVNNKLANLQIVQITKTEYDALTTKDPNTLYLIVG